MERILVVDDEEVIRGVCMQILEAEGYQVTAVASGKEALHHLTGSHFEALVTDIMMPDMSGLELLEVIRSTGLDISIVVITGLGTFDMATQSDRLGAQQFVVKPFTPDELASAVRRSISRRQQPAA